MRQQRGETVDRWTPELNLRSRGMLPSIWIPEPDVRLGIYARMARIEDDAGLDGFEDELADRFGPLPAEAVTLLEKARLRTSARAARIARIDAGPAAIALTPRQDFDAKAALKVRGLGLAEKNGRLLLAERLSEDARLERVRQLLEALAD